MDKPPVDWCRAYWDLMYNRLYSPEPMYSLLKELDQLRNLNQHQAGRIMELELLLSFVHVNGNNVVIDYQGLRRHIQHLAPNGLAASKYLRYPYERE